VELKFAPNGDKLEIRVRGESVFSEYLNSPGPTALAFDEEGFYAIGDAGYLLDPKYPEKGIVFDGRVAEDFKLTSGTWVSVGTLRPRLVGSLSPHAVDCVITGHDRDEIGALIFASPALRVLAGPGGDKMSGEQLVQVPEVRDVLLRGMTVLESETPAASRHIRRLLVLDDLPRQTAGEITDKGYINQRHSLEIRRDWVDRLYADNLDPAVLRLDEPH
jgi:feruloyl-CoA synthase